MFLATSVDLRPNSLSRRAICGLQNLADVDLGDAHVPVRVALDALELTEIVFADVQHHPLADHGDAVAAAVAHAFDDGADQGVDEHLEAERRRKLLGNQRERRARGLRDAETQVAGGTAHGDHEYQRDVVFASTMRFLTISTP